MGGMLRRLAGRVAAGGGAEDAVADVGGLGRGLCQHRDQQHGEAMAEQAGRREAAGGEAEESGSGARAHAERSLNQALRRGQHLVCETAPPPSPPRSAEHTSELQSLMRTSYAVFCLKNKTETTKQTTNDICY